MKLPHLLTLILFSSTALADVDYSRCQQSGGVLLDNDGKPMLAPNETIVSKKTDGKFEDYIIESVFNGGISSLGGYASQGKMTREVRIERDEQGRVIRVRIGKDTLDKRSADQVKKTAIETQVTTSLWMVGGGTGFEPQYELKDKNGKVVMKKVSELSKEDREILGMDEELFKLLTNKEKKDKKASQKIEKGLRDLVTRSGQTALIGQEAEFDITNGVCTPKKASKIYYNTKDGSVTKTPSYSKEACEEVEKLMTKYKESIAKCDDVDLKVGMDLFENYNNLKDIYSSPPGGGMGFGGGLGGIYGGVYGGGLGGIYGGVYGGGFGGAYGGIRGGQLGQLANLQSTCKIMQGEWNSFSFPGFTPLSGSSTK